MSDVVKDAAGAAGALVGGAASPWTKAFDAVTVAFKAFLSPEGQAIAGELRQKHGLTDPQQSAIAANLPKTSEPKDPTEAR